MKIISIALMLAFCSIPAQAGETSQLKPNVNVNNLERHDFDVGEIAIVGEVAIKINSVKRAYFSRLSAPSAGMEQILLNMTLDNKAQLECAFIRRHFKSTTEAIILVTINMLKRSMV